MSDSKTIKKTEKFKMTDDLLKSIEEGIEKQQHIILSTEDTQYSFLTFVETINDDVLSLHNSIPSSIIKRAMKSEINYLTFPRFALKCAKLETDGKYLLANALEMIDYSETREEERLSFQKGEKVTIRLVNPYDKKTMIVKRILDISNSGLSFENHFNSLLFSPGEHLENIEIQVNGSTTKTANAKVVYNRKLFDTESRQRYQIGLSLEKVEEK